MPVRASLVKTWLTNVLRIGRDLITSTAVVVASSGAICRNRLPNRYTVGLQAAGAATRIASFREVRLAIVWGLQTAIPNGFEPRQQRVHTEPEEPPRAEDPDEKGEPLHQRSSPCDYRLIAFAAGLSGA